MNLFTHHFSQECTNKSEVIGMVVSQQRKMSMSEKNGDAPRKQSLSQTNITSQEGVRIEKRNTRVVVSTLSEDV